MNMLIMEVLEYSAPIGNLLWDVAEVPSTSKPCFFTTPLDKIFFGLFYQCYPNYLGYQTSLIDETHTFEHLVSNCGAYVSLHP